MAVPLMQVREMRVKMVHRRVMMGMAMRFTRQIAGFVNLQVMD